MNTFKSKLINKFTEDPGFEWLHIFDGSTLTPYNIKELIGRIYNYCDFFRKTNLVPGDTVLIILKESLDLFAAFFAGIAYGLLPAYFAYPSPKQTKETFLSAIENLVKYNEIKIVVCFDEITEILNKQSFVNEKGFQGIINFSDLPSKNKYNLEEFTNPGAEAFLQFSSGTTGAKKGVKITVEALFNQINGYDSFVKYDETSKVVSWLPHYHDMGLIACMLMPFLKKVPIYMMSPFLWVSRPELLFELITKSLGTHTWLPNFALGHLTKSIKNEEMSKYNLASLKQIICCSETVLYETVTGFLNKFESLGIKNNSVYNCFAMAENTFAMTSTKKEGIRFIEVDDELIRQQGVVSLKKGGKRIASAGVKLPNIDIKIIDNQNNCLEKNVIGEVIIKSNCMLECYHNNPDDTGKAFHDGWFKTGDLGFFIDDELFIVGRKKDMIIVGGENIYPQDIELILNEEEYLIPGRNLAFGIEDEKSGTERIIILAETEDELSDFDLTALTTKIFNTLGVSVSEIILLPHFTLKKGTAGKISRYLNKLDYINGEFNKFIKKDASSGKYTPENKLFEIIRDITQKKSYFSLDLDTPLLNSGIIDSLGFVTFITAIEAQYGINFPKSFLKPEYFQTARKVIDTIQNSRKNGAGIVSNLPLKPELEQNEHKKEGFLKKLFKFYKEEN